MDDVIDLLRRCASHHGSAAAEELLQQLQGSSTLAGVSEDFLAVFIFTFAAGAVSGPTLEEKQDCVIGLERCLALGSQSLEPAAIDRLQRSVLDHTLRRFDAAGDALATKATQLLLCPSHETAKVTEPLRAVLALLLRCSGSERITGRDLLELVRGDVALAVAVIAEALGSPKPAGLPLWSVRLVQLLHQLSSPDSFVWLLQRAEPGKDFNATSIAEMQDRQFNHSFAVALSVVQFNTLDHCVSAAEEPTQRQSILVATLRAVHSLVAGQSLKRPGWLLSRWVALDFARLGYRFLAPLVRKLVDGSQNPEPARLLRHTCLTLSWLLFHAESDGVSFLSVSLRPLATEWAMRAFTARLPPETLAALLTLAVNCGAVDRGGPLRALVEPAVSQLKGSVEDYARRCGGAITAIGNDGLCELGFHIPSDIDEQNYELWFAPEDPDDDELYWDRYFVECGAPNPWDEEDPFYGTAIGLAVATLMPDGRFSCRECGQPCSTGVRGEGYFEGLWYCERCWHLWEQSMSNQVVLSPWEFDGVGADAVEQCGAAAWLLQAPDHLRCCVGGGLLTIAPVRVPGCAAAARPVAFGRRALERWHRRSGGRCPLTAQPLDMQNAMDSPDILELVESWVGMRMGSM